MFLISDEQGLDARGIVVWAPPGAGDVSFLHSIQAGYGALQASYWMGTGRSFSGIKVDHSLALWRSWLRHCTSIPDGDIGICNWHNPSGRTVALRLTQLLTEMSTRDISWGWRRPVRKADNPATFMCRLSWNLGASTSWKPLRPVQACNGIAYFTCQSLCLKVCSDFIAVTTLSFTKDKWVMVFSEVIRVYSGDQTKLHSQHNCSSIVLNVVAL